MQIAGLGRNRRSAIPTDKMGDRFVAKPQAARYNPAKRVAAVKLVAMKNV